MSAPVSIGPPNRLYREDERALTVGTARNRTTPPAPDRIRRSYFRAAGTKGVAFGLSYGNL